MADEVQNTALFVCSAKVFARLGKGLWLVADTERPREQLYTLPGSPPSHFVESSFTRLAAASQLIVDS
jgi:hypothetical protein